MSAVDPDFSRLTGFDWDTGNLTKSLTKHKVTRQEAEEIFADPGVQGTDPMNAGSGIMCVIFSLTSYGLEVGS